MVWPYYTRGRDDKSDEWRRRGERAKRKAAEDPAVSTGNKEVGAYGA